MGYSTWFTGQVTVSPPLNPHELHYLEQFAEARHMRRAKGPYLVNDSGFTAEGYAPDVFVEDGRTKTLPGFYAYACRWVPAEGGKAIMWNEEEKFYDADKWMAYLIDTFLKPGAAVARELNDPVPGWVYPEEFAHFTFDHVVNGAIEADGEDPQDVWRLEVRDNVVYTVHATVDPAYDEIAPTEPVDWGEDEWARFAAKSRHNVAFLVRDGEATELDPASGLVFEPVHVS